MEKRPSSFYRRSASKRFSRKVSAHIRRFSAEEFVLPPDEIIKIILRKKPEDRSEYELGKIVRILKKIQFFKERQLKEEHLQDVAQALWLESFEKGEKVFDYGEKGDKFYLIVQGSVSVLIPNPHRAQAFGEKVTVKLSKKLFIPPEENTTPTKKLELDLKSPSQFALMRARSETPKSDLSVSTTSEGEFVKVTELKKNEVFGELALLKNQPRAATIQCTSRCFLAAMDRGTYRKVLLKIEQKRLNSTIDFLHSLPYFEAWTRSTIAKFQYFFTRQDYQRHHVVYREGDPIEYIYIVFSGEFELISRQKNQVKKEVDLITYLNKEGMQNQEAKVVRKKSSHNQLDRLSSKPKGVRDSFQRVYSQSMMKLQEGNFFGEDDALSQGRKKYSYTVKCCSQEGSVLRIKASDLIKRVSISDQTLKLILQNVLHKQEYMYNRKKENKKYHNTSVEPLQNPFSSSSATLHTEPTPISHEELSSMIERKSTLQSFSVLSDLPRRPATQSKTSLSLSMRSASRDQLKHSRNLSVGGEPFKKPMSQFRTLSKGSIVSEAREAPPHSANVTSQSYPRFFHRDGSNFEIPTYTTVQTLPISRQPTQVVSTKVTSQNVNQIRQRYKQNGRDHRMRQTLSTIYKSPQNKSPNHSLYMPCAFTLLPQQQCKRLIPKVMRGPLRESVQKMMALRSAQKI